MAAAEIQTVIFRATLDPTVSRDLELQGAKNLHDLARAIVEAFDFDFDHAYGFFSKLTGNIFNSPMKYELFADMEESDSRSAKRTRIEDVFPAVGAAMTFLFDYGDEWRFRIEVIGQGRKQPKCKYPRLIKSVGKAPEQYPDPEEDE